MDCSTIKNVSVEIRISKEKMHTQIVDFVLRNKKANYFWYFALILSVAPFFILCLYNLSSIHDDYLNANYIIKSGSIEYVKNNYLHWTGRYTELLIKSILNPLTYEKPDLIAHIFPVILILLIGLAIYFIFIQAVEKYEAIQLSAIVLIIFICTLTDIGSFIYWSGGYTAYSIGVIFSMIFFVFLYKMKKNATILNFFICCIFAVLSIGCYEVILVIIVWVTLTNIVYSRINNKGLKYASALFLVSLLSALFSILAPGNFARASGIGDEAAAMSVGRIIMSTCKSLLFATASFISWMNNLVLMIGVLLVFQILIKSNKINFDKFNIHPVIVLVWAVIGFSISIFPSISAYQNVWIHTWQCVYFFFMTGFIIIVGSFLRYLNYNVRNLLVNDKIIWIARLVFVVSVFINSSSNVYIAYWDLLYAPEYKRRVEVRIASARQAAKSNTVLNIQPLYSNSEKYLVPKSLYTLEHSESDAVAFASYYGVDSVVVSRCHL